MVVPARRRRRSHLDALAAAPSRRALHCRTGVGLGSARPLRALAPSRCRARRRCLVSRPRRAASPARAPAGRRGSRSAPRAAPRTAHASRGVRVQLVDDRELERLPAVAELERRAERTSSSPLVRRAARGPARPARRRPARSRRPSARRRSTARCAGRPDAAAKRRARAPPGPPTHAGRRSPRSRARRRSRPACSPPAPPKHSSAYPRGSIPRCTVTTRSARSISALATRTIPSAHSASDSPSSSASAPIARCAASRSSWTPPASGASGPDTQARGWRRSPSARCRRGRSRPVLDRRPPTAARRVARRPDRARRSSRRRRPTVCTATIGSASGRPAIVAALCSWTAPSSTTQTSHEVPPMSKHSASRRAGRPGHVRRPGGAAGRSREHRPRRVSGRGAAARSGRRWTA